MANQHIINNTLIVTGSVTASLGFYGDGSGLTGITSVSEWDGSRNGDASITGSFIVSSSTASVDFSKTTGVSGSFSGDGSGLTNLNLNGYQASGSNFTGSFSGDFTGDGSGLTGIGSFPYTGVARITGSLIVSGGLVDMSEAIAISGSTFSGSFVGNGSGLTGLPQSEWDGSRDGDASITGSLAVSGSGVTVKLLGRTTIDKNIDISNSGNITDISIGNSTLPDTTIVSRNSIAIGYQAASAQTSGSNNISIGTAAASSAVKTQDTIAIGYSALRSYEGQPVSDDINTSSNIAIGNQASFNSVSGIKSIVIGHQANYCSITSNASVIIGHHAGYNSLSNDNILIGKEAGYAIVNGSDNVAIGSSTLNTGYTAGSVAIGSNALRNLNGGKFNTAVGLSAGLNATGASDCNVFIGNGAGPTAQTLVDEKLYINNKASAIPLILGDFVTKEVKIHNNLVASGSITSQDGFFIGDGSQLTGIAGSGFPYTGAAQITGSLTVKNTLSTNTAATVEKGHTILTQVSESLNFRDDAEAALNGVPLGGLYRSRNIIMIRIN